MLAESCRTANKNKLEKLYVTALLLVSGTKIEFITKRRRKVLFKIEIEIGSRIRIKALLNSNSFSKKQIKMGNRVSLEDEMVNLRIVSKQMQRSAKKCEKNEKASMDKLKKVSSRFLSSHRVLWKLIHCVIINCSSFFFYLFYFVVTDLTGYSKRESRRRSYIWSRCDTREKSGLESSSDGQSDRCLVSIFYFNSYILLLLFQYDVHIYNSFDPSFISLLLLLLNPSTVIGAL